MTTLPVDYADVPDFVPAIGSGTYLAEILEVELNPAKKDPENEAKRVLHLSMKITADGEGGDTVEAGRNIQHWLALWTDMGKSASKRMVLSAGLDPKVEGGVSLVEFIGRTVKIRTGVKVQEDKDDPTISIERAEVRDYLFTNPNSDVEIPE